MSEFPQAMEYRRRFEWLDKVLADPAISPRALKLAHILVKDFLNRDKGYAYPSQDRLAAVCAMSRRTVQRALYELEHGGWLKIVGEGGRHQASHYRPMFKALTPPHLAAENCATAGAVLGPKNYATNDAVSGETASDLTETASNLTGNCVTDAALLLSKNLKKNPHRRARKGEIAGEETRPARQTSLMLPITSDRNVPRQSAATDPWPEIWAAILLWPGLEPTVSEPRARAAWQRNVDCSPREFLACVWAHGQRLVTRNARRKNAGDVLVTHPHNWIERDRGWTGYLADVRAEIAGRGERAERAALEAFGEAWAREETAAARVREQSECAARLEAWLAEWGEPGRVLLAALGEPIVRMWFLKTAMSGGAPTILSAPTALHRSNIERHAAALDAAFAGSWRVEIVARRERAA